MKPFFTCLVFLVGCTAPTMRADMPPPSQYQVAANYDHLASCFARRSQDRDIVSPVQVAPVIQHYSNPDEIRVSMGGGTTPLVWMLDFRSTGADRTTIEFRINVNLSGANKLRGRVIEDLRACGADVT